MLKKPITYTDFNGREVTEVHAFHFSGADMIELKVKYKNKGGIQAWLEEALQSEDEEAMVEFFKKLIFTSYGKLSEDGSRHLQSPEILAEFQSSQAYETLLWEVCTDEEKGLEFFNGIFPQEIMAELAKKSASEEAVEMVKEMASVAVPGEVTLDMSQDAFDQPEGPRPITQEQANMMDPDLLKDLLHNGVLVISDPSATEE